MGFEKVNLIKCTTLAYVGDAVFTLYVRAKYGSDPSIPTHELMRKCAHIVSAVMQARIHDELLSILTVDELDLMNRCRNAHVTNRAKNATMREYKKATALEGLFGALYLIGDKDRLDELLIKSLEIGGKNEQG